MNPTSRRAAGAAVCANFLFFMVQVVVSFVNIHKIICADFVEKAVRRASPPGPGQNAKRVAPQRATLSRYTLYVYRLFFDEKRSRFSSKKIFSPSKAPGENPVRHAHGRRAAHAHPKGTLSPPAAARARTAKCFSEAHVLGKTESGAKFDNRKEYST